MTLQAILEWTVSQSNSEGTGPGLPLPELKCVILKQHVTFSSKEILDKCIGTWLECLTV